MSGTRRGLMPAGKVSANLFVSWANTIFSTTLSLMDDVNPYGHILEDASKGPIELPWHWSLDDASYALFSIKSPRPIFTNEHMRGVFKEEFREI